MRDEEVLLNRRLARIAVALGERDLDGSADRFMDAAFRAEDNAETWAAVRWWDGKRDIDDPQTTLFGHWALRTARFTEMLVWPQAVVNALTFHHRARPLDDEEMDMAAVVVKSWEDEYGPLGDLVGDTSYAWREISAAGAD